MDYIHIIAETLPQAYHSALVALEEQGHIYPCDNQDQTDEMKEISIIYTVTNNATTEPRISRLFCGGHRELQEYELELTKGIKDFLIGKPKFWEYTYSQRLLPYVDFIVAELTRNTYSRRAVIAIRDNAVDTTNNNPACLQSLLFNIRDGKLHMTVMFRSNDAVRANFMNAFALTRLQEIIAAKLNVAMGSYTHIAESFHAYKESWGTLTNYVNKIKSNDLDDITYNYQDFYKDVMAETLPDIYAQLQGLKDKYL